MNIGQFDDKGISFLYNYEYSTAVKISTLGFLVEQMELYRASTYDDSIF